MDAPDEIWAIIEAEDGDFSADILPDIRAYASPDGLVDKPTKYIRADLVEARVEALEAALVATCQREAEAILRHDTKVKNLEAEMEDRIAEAVKAEREACAAVADEWAKDAEVEAEKPIYRASSRMSKLDYAYRFRRIADGIRARCDQ